jgi:tetratricopeptide (TPR) repeat protein
VLTLGQVRLLDTLLALDLPPETRGLTRARLARVARWSATAQVEEAAREAAQVLATVQASGDAPLAALAATRLAQARFRAGHNTDAIAYAREAIEMSRALGDPSSEARALAIEAAALGSIDRRQEALVRFEQALSLSRRVGDRVGQLEAASGIAFCQFDRGFHAAAREQYEQVLELAHAIDAKRMTLVVTGYLGLLELDRERPVDALELATAAIAAAREFGEVRAEGTFLAIAGAARAELDELAAAEQAADDAERLLLPHPMFLEVAHIYRGLVDLAVSRHAAARRDLDVARRYRSAARARIATATASKLVERSDDARIAIRVLKRALDRSRMSITPAPSAALLTVGWHGAWFVVGPGERIDLSRRAPLRALLWLLAEHREAQPGTAIPIDQLIAAAWPGQKMVRSSALNRLHVAFATLRSLGLKDVLQRRGEGYLLTPAIALRIEG